ncbi:MAG: hypothetical protein ABGZ23_06070 [Fuerstiella sp.]
MSSPAPLFASGHWNLSKTKDLAKSEGKTEEMRLLAAVSGQIVDYVGQ